MNRAHTRHVGLGIAGALVTCTRDVATLSLWAAKAGSSTPLVAPLRRPARRLVSAAEHRGALNEARLLSDARHISAEWFAGAVRGPVLDHVVRTLVEAGALERVRQDGRPAGRGYAHRGTGRRQRCGRAARPPPPPDGAAASRRDAGQLAGAQSDRSVTGRGGAAARRVSRRHGHGQRPDGRSGPAATARARARGTARRIRGWRCSGISGTQLRRGAPLRGRGRRAIAGERLQLRNGGFESAARER